MKKKKQPLVKKFVVKKYIMAVSASEALKKERRFKADDVWVDEEWSKIQTEKTPAIGFSAKRQGKYDF